jgi:hypothetical protein
LPAVFRLAFRAGICQPKQKERRLFPPVEMLCMAGAWLRKAGLGPLIPMLFAEAAIGRLGHVLCRA